MPGVFLHANGLHLAFNMFYLWVFGDNVEERYGPVSLFLLFLAGDLVSRTLFLAAHPGHVLVGASAGVATLMGAYLVLFPENRIKVAGFLLYHPFKREVPAVAALGAWLALQGLFGLLFPTSPVAYIAHIFGFMVGFVVTMILRNAGRVQADSRLRAGSPYRVRPPAVDLRSGSPPEIPVGHVCPACLKPLSPVSSVPRVDECRFCAGNWVFNFESGSLRNARITSARILRPLPVSDESVVRFEGERCCPDCTLELEPFEVGAVVVERCPTCAGAWLARGELRKLCAPTRRRCRPAPREPPRSAESALKKDAKNFLIRLVEAHGSPGYQLGFQKIFRGRVRACDRVETDVLGSVLGGRAMGYLLATLGTVLRLRAPAPSDQLVPRNVAPAARSLLAAPQLELLGSVQHQPALLDLQLHRSGHPGLDALRRQGPSHSATNPFHQAGGGLLNLFAGGPDLEQQSRLALDELEPGKDGAPLLIFGQGDGVGRVPSVDIPQDFLPTDGSPVAQLPVQLATPQQHGHFSLAGTESGWERGDVRRRLG